MEIIYSRNCFEAWINSLSALCSKGIRTGGIIEILNLVNHIQNPTEIDGSSEATYRKYASQKSIKRATTLLLGKGRYRGKITYWERLTNWHGKVDQLAMVVDRLSSKPQSKHLTCSVIDPETDWKTRGFMPSQPCLLAIDFRLRGQRLNLTGYFRSQDIMNIGYTDFRGLSKYLQTVTSDLHRSPKARSVQVGDLTCHTTSAFVNAKDLHKAEKVLSYCVRTYPRTKIR
jgi:thymidylate synthase